MAETPRLTEDQWQRVWAAVMPWRDEPDSPDRPTSLLTLVARALVEGEIRRQMMIAARDALIIIACHPATEDPSAEWMRKYAERGLARAGFILREGRTGD